MRRAARLIIVTSLIFAFIGMSHISATPVLVYSNGVSAKVFEHQMEFLKAHRYNVISLEEFAEYLRANQKIPRKSVVITFDGGLKELYESRYLVLKKMGYPSIVYIHANALGYPGFLKASEVRTLLRNGVDIGSKGLSGLSFENKPQAEARTEIFGSKRSLENILSYPVNHFSYPDGYYDDSAKALTEEAGYLSAVALDSGMRGKLDRYAIPRIAVTEHDSNLLRFWIKISGFYRFKNIFRNIF